MKHSDTDSFWNSLLGNVINEQNISTDFITRWNPNTVNNLYEYTNYAQTHSLTNSKELFGKIQIPNLQWKNELCYNRDSHLRIVIGRKVTTSWRTLLFCTWSTWWYIAFTFKQIFMQGSVLYKIKIADHMKAFYQCKVWLELLFKYWTRFLRLNRISSFAVTLSLACVTLSIIDCSYFSVQYWTRYVCLLTNKHIQ